MWPYHAQPTDVAHEHAVLFHFHEMPTNQPSAFRRRRFAGLISKEVLVASVRLLIESSTHSGDDGVAESLSPVYPMASRWDG